MVPQQLISCDLTNSLDGVDQILSLQHSPQPAIWIVRLVAERRGLAEAGKVVEFAGLNGGTNFVFSDYLNCAIREHGCRFKQRLIEFSVNSMSL